MAGWEEEEEEKTSQEEEGGSRYRGRGQAVTPRPHPPSQPTPKPFPSSLEKVIRRGNREPASSSSPRAPRKKRERERERAPLGSPPLFFQEIQMNPQRADAAERCRQLLALHDNLPESTWPRRTDAGPFLGYRGSLRHRLPNPPPLPRDHHCEPCYGDLFSGSPATTPSPLDRVTLSLFLYDAFAVPRMEPAAAAAAATRANPSCGCVHATEAHIISRHIPGVADFPSVMHYSPEDHALELRAVVPGGFFDGQSLPPDSVLVGLSTIFWREARRHGDRGFRYCHLEVGHVIAAVAFAAAALGWGARLLPSLGLTHLESIMGLKPTRPSGKAPGHVFLGSLQRAACLLLLFPNDTGKFQIDYGFLGGKISECSKSIKWLVTDLDTEEIDMVGSGIYKITKIVELPDETGTHCSTVDPRRKQASMSFLGWWAYGTHSVRDVVRSQRRALAMDPEHHMQLAYFYQLLFHCLPPLCWHNGNERLMERVVPFGVFPGKHNSVPVFIFVHRVEELERGLYCLVGYGTHCDRMEQLTCSDYKWEQVTRSDFKWEQVSLSFYRLLSGDLQERVKEIACGQRVAMDSCFTVMMVAPIGDGEGLWMYNQLFWEAGCLGQLLSLEAHALELSACGIGSFIDQEGMDPYFYVHRLWFIHYFNILKGNICRLEYYMMGESSLMHKLSYNGGTTIEARG